MSEDGLAIIDAAAAEAARRRWRRIGSRSIAEALGYFTKEYRARMSFVIARGYARHRLRVAPLLGVPYSAVQQQRRYVEHRLAVTRGGGQRLEDFFRYQVAQVQGVVVVD